MSLKSLNNDLHKIISDNKSGSRDLLDNLHKYLDANRDEITNELISSLHSKLSEFQTIQNYLVELENALSKNSLDSFFEQKTAELKEVYSKIYSNLKPEIERIHSFITISNSRTLLEIFKLIMNDKSHSRIFVSEGRPVKEGHILAENLAEAGIGVSLITEAQIYDTVQKCECGIIGADKVLANGNVVNKVGSSLLALACREFNKPFFVVTDKSKFSHDNSFDKKEKPADEIYAGSSEINISNFYFEEIPNELITNIITD